MRMRLQSRNALNPWRSHWLKVAQAPFDCWGLPVQNDEAITRQSSGDCHLSDYSFDFTTAAVQTVRLVVRDVTNSPPTTTIINFNVEGNMLTLLRQQLTARLGKDVSSLPLYCYIGGDVNSTPCPITDAMTVAGLRDNDLILVGDVATSDGAQKV